MLDTTFSSYYKNFLIYWTVLHISHCFGIIKYNFLICYVEIHYYVVIYEFVFHRTIKAYLHIDAVLRGYKIVLYAPRPF